MKRAPMTIAEKEAAYKQLYEDIRVKFPQKFSQAEVEEIQEAQRDIFTTCKQTLAMQRYFYEQSHAIDMAVFEYMNLYHPSDHGKSSGITCICLLCRIEKENEPY